MKHKLAVVIVNYNVAFFLEQCIHSVLKAAQNVPTEIWIVDNDSKDGSVDMVRQKFPQINLIANKDNLGFSKANNQAIKKCNSEYILLLNPDTVVEENTFDRVVAFMDEHPNTGGLGVKMIDGKGEFLPESKRGLPTPAVAFYKIFGLAKLFPNSKKFGRYHLGFLDKNKNHKIDILSGAFMLMRHETLEKVGLLDETFFMYGEDIDLSYRITQGGYDNYYFADTSIIHYKGESTKKSSVNYIFVFYKAMVIFAEKHFSSKNAKLFSILINMAIWFRATIALIFRFIKWLTLPLIDLAIIQGGLYLIKNWYESYSGIDYSGTTYPYAFLSYGLIWVIAMYFNGSYDRPIALKKNVVGLLYGTGIILIIYALLPENLRFSRAIILIGSTFATAAVLFLRFLYSFILKDYKIKGVNFEKYLIIGKNDEISRVMKMLNKVDIASDKISTLLIENNGSNVKNALSTIRDNVEFNNINEVIFCAKDITAEDIIRQMSSIENTKVHFKIAPPESMFIIGSNSSNSSGDFLSFNVNAISSPINKRNKRILDVIASLLLLIFSPFHIWFIENKVGFYKNSILIFLGQKSWVGYMRRSSNYTHLPKIKKGVFHALSHIDKETLDDTIIEKSNVLYAKNYHPQTDIQIILRNWKQIGAKIN